MYNEHMAMIERNACLAPVMRARAIVTYTVLTAPYYSNTKPHIQPATRNNELPFVLATAATWLLVAVATEQLE